MPDLCVYSSSLWSTSLIKGKSIVAAPRSMRLSAAPTTDCITAHRERGAWGSGIWLVAPPIAKTAIIQTRPLVLVFRSAFRRQRPN